MLTPFKAPARTQDINEWTLFHYVEVLAYLRKITAPTADQVRLAKDFRNLLHPGGAARLGQVCDQGTAHGAFAAVQMVARDSA